MTAFHSRDYINHLKNVAPHLQYGTEDAQAREAAYSSNCVTLATAKEDYKVGENDCPCFSGMFEFS